MNTGSLDNWQQLVKIALKLKVNIILIIFNNNEETWKRRKKYKNLVKSWPLSRDLSELFLPSTEVRKKKRSRVFNKFSEVTI